MGLIKIIIRYSKLFVELLPAYVDSFFGMWKSPKKAVDEEENINNPE